MSKFSTMVVVRRTASMPSITMAKPPMTAMPSITMVKPPMTMRRREISMTKNIRTELPKKKYIRKETIDSR